MASDPPPTAAGGGNRRQKSAVEKECLSCLVSLQECFQYLRAKFVGLGKKIRARSEEEAMAADLEASKIEVEAADHAENAKKRIYN